MILWSNVLTSEAGNFLQRPQRDLGVFFVLMYVCNVDCVRMKKSPSGEGRDG